MKKKAIKIASASVMAASSFAAIAPFTTEAAVNLDATVNNAVSVALQAHQLYTTPAKSGQLVDWHVVQKQLIVAKNTYNSAVATINKNAGSKKAYYLGKLASASRYMGYAQGYITATDNAQKAHHEANLLGASKTVADAKTAFTNFTADINSYKANVTKLTADTLTKNLLVKVYFSYPESLKTIIPAVISANDSLMAAEAALAKGDATTAKTNLDAYTAQLPNFNASGANVVNVVKAYQKTVQGKYDDATAAPMVTGVSAINLKQVLVTFNKEVDVDSAELAANYTYTGTTTIANRQLQADGKSVLLTLTGSEAQQATATLKVENVKDTKGNVIDSTTKTVTFFDATVPSAVSATLTAPTKVQVKFSEPVSATTLSNSAFVLDNNTYSLASAPTQVSPDTIELTLAGALPTGAHTIQVNPSGVLAANKLVDYAGFAVSTGTVNFNYALDTTAPTVSVDRSSQNSVTLKFSKDIDPATQANLSVYHTYNSVPGYVGSVSWTDNKTAVVTFATNYLPTGNTTLFVNTGTAPNVVKDTWGNAFASTSLNTNVTADNQAPTVSGVSVYDATHIDVTYSEAVSGATTLTNYTLKDADGNTVSVSGATLVSGNKYRLTTGTLTGGTYTLGIKGIKDTSVAQNALADYTQQLSVTDMVKPTVTNTGVFSTDKKKAIVSFSERMATSGAGSVLDKANYQVSFDGTSYVDLSTISGATVSLGADGKSVVVDFGSAQSSLVSGTSKIRVARVADLAGNTTSGFTTDVTLSTDNVTIANISDVKAIASNKVQFKLNTALSAINVADFNIQVGATDVPATSATYVNSGNTSIVTVEIPAASGFATDLTTTKALTNVEFTAGGVTTALGTSNSGTVTQAVTASTADYVAPAISSVATVDSATANGKVDKVVLTFSEALYAASVQESDFTVDGYQITGVNATGNTVTLDVKEKDTTDTDATPKVTLVGSVSDNSAQRNTLGNQAAVTATDGVAPVVASFTRVNATTVDVTFSEAVDKTTAEAGAYTVATAAAGDTVTLTSAALQPDGKTVRLVFGGAVIASGDTVTVPNTVLDKATNAVGAASLVLAN